MLVVQAAKHIELKEGAQVMLVANLSEAEVAGPMLDPVDGCEPWLADGCRA